MAARSTSHPTWQRDTCPAWCAVEHAEHDPPGDRFHDSTGSYIPAVLGRTSLDDSTTVELLVVMSRRCGELDDWIFIGEPESDGQHLVLSRESAARVATAVTALLAD